MVVWAVEGRFYLIEDFLLLFGVMLRRLVVLVEQFFNRGVIGLQQRDCVVFRHFRYL